MTEWPKGVRYADWRFAHGDELDIEDELLDMAASDNFRADLVCALRRIDRTKVDGTYDAQRAELRKKLEHLRLPAIELSEGQMRAAELVSNFAAGCRSPDPDQRRRFKKLLERIGADCLGEWMDVMAAIEPAKRHKGKRRISPPWRNVAEHMDAMRSLLASEDISIPEAARRIADGEGRAQRRSRAEYFEKMYRQKAALREIK